MADVAAAGATGRAGSWIEAMRALAAWIQKRRQRAPRRLRLCETVSLGERRFLALVECEDRRWLIGSTSDSLVMLAALPANAEMAPAANPLLQRSEEAEGQR